MVFMPQFLTPGSLYYNIPWAVTCHVPFSWKITRFPAILAFTCLNFPFHRGCYVWFWNFLKILCAVCHRLVSSLWYCWEMTEILGGGAMWKEVRSFGECLWKGILWQWSLLLLSFASQQPWCKQSPSTSTMIYYTASGLMQQDLLSKSWDCGTR